MYLRICERLSFPIPWHGQNGRILRHWHAMSGFAGLSPSRNLFTSGFSSKNPEPPNQKAAHRAGTYGTQGRNAPALLLARLSSPLKSKTAESESCSPALDQLSGFPCQELSSSASAPMWKEIMIWTVIRGAVRPSDQLAWRGG